MRSDVEVRERALEDELYLLKRQVAQAVDGVKNLRQMLSMLARSAGGGGGGAPTPFAGKTSSAGISAATGTASGSASVTLYDLTVLPTLTLTSTVVTAYGTFPDSATGIYRVDGLVINGVYLIYSAACTAG